MTGLLRKIKNIQPSLVKNIQTFSKKSTNTCIGAGRNVPTEREVRPLARERISSPCRQFSTASHSKMYNKPKERNFPLLVEQCPSSLAVLWFKSQIYSKKLALPG